MIYLEHYLREGGVESLASAVILAPRDGEAACRDLADEILDLFPGASVRVVPVPEPEREPEVVPPCDLLVSVFTAPCRLPFHDVVYEHLDQLSGLLRHQAAARFVMIFGVSWRNVEVVPARSLPGLVRKRRIEARLIRLLERSKLLRRLLRPLYAQV